ncbi:MULTISPECIES: GAF domain-containing protein [Subtercola]|uniref:GAF domain-containing protein n=1 Tax=Subtercola vilae TaxID=2056433 RepID=A0A4T2CAE6_9MICO|nr:MULTISPECIES: GAF domain-containing protein [Subtercola]MEA9983817.1 GAF domain-containing protein [Subtercola sp. RTI3]TIH40642.1 GAF domain-containing protein [Subtercola vilae]
MTGEEFLSFPDAQRGQLDQAITDLVGKARDVLSTQGRLRALLRANQAVVEQLDLPVVLERIVAAAVELVGAQYGALGVLSPQGGLEQFINVGMTPEDIRVIGHLPEGHGLLGALIDDPRPIRLEQLSADSRSSGFPVGHPPMGSFLGVPIRVRSEVYGNLYLSNQASGSFSAEDEQLVTALAATAGVAIENARLFAETRRRQRWSAASAEITSALLSSDDTDLISVVASRVLPLAEADLVFVLVQSDRPDTLIVETVAGTDPLVHAGQTHQISTSPLGGVLEGGQPRLFGSGELKLRFSADLHAGPAMTIPLFSDGVASGLMVVVRTTERLPFISSDLELAADFAGQASLAMELARARADRQRSALLEDRARIARDLHDHVIQQIFATGLELQSVAGGLRSRSDSDRIVQSVANLDSSIAQIRTIIFALSGRPASSEQTMRHRMLDLINELGAGFIDTPQVTFAGPVDLIITDELADDVVAVCREALTNIAKHASATKSSMTLHVLGDEVELVVRDNGVGIPAAGRQSGLRNLRRRATDRGGSFTVTSAPGETALLWRVPLPEVEG